LILKNYFHINCIFKIIVTLYCISLSLVSNAQVGKNDLLPFLSPTERNKISKFEAIYNKGTALEQESDKIKNSGTTDKESARNEKKANIKRLEASQFYYKANNDFIFFLKDNIKSFWKQNKGAYKNATVQNHEDKANELYKKSRSLRKMADDLVYPEEKLITTIEAEQVEKESITIYIKVLYAYLNPPFAYNELKTSPNTVASFENIATPVKKDTVLVKSNPVKPVIKDSIQNTAKLIKKDTIVTQKTVSQDPKPLIDVKQVPPTVIKEEIPPIIANSDTKPNTTEAVKEKPKSNPNNVGLSDKRIFMIQVAASKIQINLQTFQKYKEGNIKAKEIKEDGWNKYLIGDFSTLNEAKQYKEKKNTGGYITAYLNGKRVSPN